MHQANPALTQRELSQAVGVAASTISFAFKRYRETAGIRCKHCGSLLPYLRDAIKEK